MIDEESVLKQSNRRTDRSLVWDNRLFKVRLCKAACHCNEKLTVP